MISDTLVPMDPTNALLEQCSVRILGENRMQTVIKLRDSAPGYTNALSPKYVLKTGNRPTDDGSVGLPNSGFGNYIQNLTIDVGSGNPGAVGVRYDVANWGAMEHVTIRSSDENHVGYSGLLFKSVCGAGYVKDVCIEGFDYGVYFDNGSVKKTDGLFSRLMKPAGNATAEIRIANVSGEFFLLENITTERISVIYDSAKTVVVRHSPKRGAIQCDTNASGDLFVEDVGPHVEVNISNGVSAWIRQLNRESTGLTNEGGMVWLFDDNVERMANQSGIISVKPISTINSGRAELLGGALDALWYQHLAEDWPLIKCDFSSRVSAVYAGELRTADGSSRGSWESYILDRKPFEPNQVTEADAWIVPRGDGGTCRFFMPPYRSP